MRTQARKAPREATNQFDAAAAAGERALARERARVGAPSSASVPAAAHARPHRALPAARAVPRAFFGVDKGGAETRACDAYRTRPGNEACRCAVGRGDAGLT